MTDEGFCGWNFRRVCLLGNRFHTPEMASWISWNPVSDIWASMDPRNVSHFNGCQWSMSQFLFRFHWLPNIIPAIWEPPAATEGFILFTRNFFIWSFVGRSIENSRLSWKGTWIMESSQVFNSNALALSNLLSHPQHITFFYIHSFLFISINLHSFQTSDLESLATSHKTQKSPSFKSKPLYTLPNHKNEVFRCIPLPFGLRLLRAGSRHFPTALGWRCWPS